MTPRPNLQPRSQCRSSLLRRRHCLLPEVRLASTHLCGGHPFVSCTARDGTRAAYSAVGEGPPLVIPLDSENHILLGTEPAWEQFATEAGRFLAPD